MSGRQSKRGGSPGRGDRAADDSSGGRGRGSQVQVQTSESRAGRGGRGDRIDRGDRGGRSGAGGFSRGDRGRFGQDGRKGKGEIVVFSDASGGYPNPSVQVRDIEDKSEGAIQDQGSSNPNAFLENSRLPLRPGYGTFGEKVTLWANYFDMTVPMDLQLFRYSVNIAPNEAGRVPVGRKSKRIIELLIEENFSEHHDGVATDYKSNLICRSRLFIDEEGYRVRYRMEGEDEPSQNAGTYTLHLQATGTLAVSELMDYLTSSHASAFLGSKDEIIQALNIVIGHYPKTAQNIFSVGANKRFELNPADSEKMSLGAGLEAVRGLFVSVRAATARILLNVQVKHASCYEGCSLVELVSAFMADNGKDKAKLNKFLKGIRVRVIHIIRRNRAGCEIPRIKKITGLATPSDGQSLPQRPRVPDFGAGSKEVEFFLVDPGKQPRKSQQSPMGKIGKKGKKPIKEDQEPSSGRYISVYEFFKNTYNFHIQDPKMPVINVSNQQNPIYLPLDACVVEPGQPSVNKLTASQTQQMIRFAVRKPFQNARSIIANSRQLLDIESATNSTLCKFGIAVIPKLITVPGRVLAGPDVKYKGNALAKTESGSWNMRNVTFSAGSELSHWTYLLLSSKHHSYAWDNDRHYEELKKTLDTLKAKLGQVGIRVSNCDKGLRIDLDQENVEADIGEAIQKFLNRSKPPELILVIIPYLDSSIYNRVKYICDVKEGILNICVLGQKLEVAQPSYFTSLSLKFNLKLGGRNQGLGDAPLGIIAEGKTMVVGIDVTHPSPGSSSNAPSVAGIVASVDAMLGQWPADLRVQRARQEMVSGLDEMLKSRLMLWGKKNRRLPENILIYRDGVSEGQYGIVLDQELPLLRKACKETYPATDSAKGLPRMSIIIVGKRHHTRFYPTRTEDADSTSNPRNGTVVDRGVTEARNWDFYLQSHTALQGTARPAHYYTILDEIIRGREVRHPFSNAADVLEDLTHNLCYLFGRATKAVSICPPAYYADLVCERARCYLSSYFDATPGATPGSSVVDGREGGHGDWEHGLDPSLVRIHEKVKDAMFYI